MQKYKNFFTMIFILAIAYPVLALILPGCGAGGGGFTVTTSGVTATPASPSSSPTQTPENGTRYAYVVDSMNPVIHVYNAETFTFVKNMGEGYLSEPHGMCFSNIKRANNLPRYLYVANTVNVKKFDLTTQSIDPNWAAGVVNSATYCRFVAISPDDKYLYSRADSSKIIVTDTTSKLDVATMNSGINSALNDFAITPDGLYAIMSDSGWGPFWSDSYHIPIAKLSDNTIFQPHLLHNIGFTWDVAIEPSGHYAYLTANNNYGNDRVIIVNIQSRAIVGFITIGEGAHGIIILPNGNHAYVTNNFSNDVSVLSLAGAQTTELPNRINVGHVPLSPGVSSDGNYVWVPCSGSSKIHVIRTSDNIVSKIIDCQSYNHPQRIIVE